MRRVDDDDDDALRCLATMPTMLRCLVRATGMRVLVCVPPTAFPPKENEELVQLFIPVMWSKHEAMYEVRRQQCC